MERRKVPQKLNKDASGDFVYGINTVAELLNAGKPVEKIFVKKDIKNIQVGDILKEAYARKIPVSKVPVEKLNRITRKNHQGIVCYIAPVTYAHTDQVLFETFERGRQPLFLILDQITDIRNFGAIARTAESTGASALIIPEKGGPLITSDALKTSSGALHYIPVCRERDLQGTVQFLKESGLKVYACTEKGVEPLYQADFDQPAAIIMGAEDKGISAGLLKMADTQLKIPMTGELQSLNVSVSAGIVLYECLRQRLVANG